MTQSIFNKPGKTNSLGQLYLQKRMVRCSGYRSSRPEMFCDKGALKVSQYSQENICVGVSFQQGPFKSAALLKIGSNTADFLRNLPNF